MDPAQGRWNRIWVAGLALPPLWPHACPSIMAQISGGPLPLAWIILDLLATVGAAILILAGVLSLIVLWRRRHQELALQHDRFLQQLIDVIPMPVYIKNAKGRYLKCNKAIESFLGRTKQDIIGKAADDLKSKVQGQAMDAKDTELLQNQGIQIFEAPVTTSQGLNRDAVFHRTVFLEADGRAGGIIGAILDVTERKRTAEQMRQLAMVVEQAAEAVIVTDVQGAIQYVNPAFERMSGYSRGEVLGKNPRLLKSGRQDDKFYRKMWQTLTRGEAWTGQFTNRRKNGDLNNVETIISPIRDSDGKIISYVADMRDVTRERLLEEQFRQAQKMDAVGRLAGGIAHDFNNLLQAIMGFSEILLSEISENDPKRKDVGEIIIAADRAQALTRQLLAFSRKQVIESKVLNLNVLVSNQKKILQRLVGEDITIDTILEPILWRVKADPGQIEQVIMNLSVNARDAMPEGGRLTVRTANITLRKEDTALIPDYRPGHFVCLSVSDTGVGMDQETQAHLFEPFFTTKKAGKGTGLGLAMIYGVARQHEGWVHVYSQVGQGTTFKLYLPALVSQDDSESFVEVDAVLATLSGQGQKILLIEDEAGVRNLASYVLTRYGYDPRVATTGREALELFLKENGEFDLIFADVVLPDLNGLDLVERMLSHKPDLPILMTSGYTDERSRWPIIQKKGYRFLQKPYPVVEMLKAVHEIITGTAAPPAAPDLRKPTTVSKT